MKDLGNLTYSLGLEIVQNNKGIHIHQRNYVEDLMYMAHLTNTKTENTPMEIGVKFQKDDGSTLTDPTIYDHPVGSLIYLSL